MMRQWHVLAKEGDERLQTALKHTLKLRIWMFAWASDKRSQSLTTRRILSCIRWIFANTTIWIAAVRYMSVSEGFEVEAH
jgi:hypothetical protein